MFFYVLHRVDVSVMNAAWVFLALFVSLGSFFFLGESWSGTQAIGVVMALVGILFLSYWHKHISVFRTILLIGTLGFLYSPIFLIQKAALLSGESVFVSFYWPVFFSKIAAFSFPLVSRKYRSGVQELRSKLSPSLVILSGLATTCSITGFFLFTRAFDLGLASIVTVTENAQPFFAMFFAWVVTRVTPNYAPRELLTAQSVQVKLVSFIIVFVGLGMLAMG